MAFIIKDRIKEGTTTTGTGDITLGGAPATFESFQSYMTNGDTTYYAIVHTASGVDEWEVGLGTWNTGNTLTRTTVLAGSSGTSAVNFSTGTKDIFMTYPAAHAALAGDDVTFDNITVTGTVDGRDVAADGTKLDTVEQNADVTDAVNVAAAGALMKSGGTMTGALILNADPNGALGAATKQYVDTIASAGIHYHAPVRAEHPSNLNATYNNGSSGVGATLTNAGTNAALVIDGVNMALNDRVLVANQTDQTQNGVYTVTTVGDSLTAWVLTRSTDTNTAGPSDPDAFGKGDAFFIKEGNTNAGHLDVLSTAGTIVFGTTNIVFSEVAETTVYSGGTGITLTGTTFSIGQDVGTTDNVTFNQVTAAIIGNVTGNLTGDVTGNAGTATKLATARTVQLSGDVTGSASFDGSANINITAAVTDDSHAHVISNVDGLQTALDGKVPTSRTITAGNGLTGGGDLTANRTIDIDSSYTGFDGRYYTETEADSRFVNVTGDTITGALTLSQDGTDVLNFTASTTNDARGISFNSKTALTADSTDGYLRLNNSSEFSNGVFTPGVIRADGGFNVNGSTVFHDGYHPNADKWTTARTLTLSGDASGSVSWDGSANATLSVTVANDSHSHSNYITSNANDSMSGILTFTSTNNAFAEYNGSGLSPYFRFKTSGINNGYIQFESNGNSYFWNDRANQGIKVASGTSGLTWYTGGAYRTIWHSANDGSGSGLDADMLDGYHVSTTRNATNSVPVRDGNGYLQLGWINTTSGATTSTINKIYASYDNYIRYITPATFRSQITDGYYLGATAKAADSNLLDGIDSSSFVRSDASDTLTGGTYTLSSTTDQKIILQGSTDPYIRFQEGTTNRAYIQWNASGNVLRFQNQESDYFDFRPHDATGAVNIRLRGSDDDIWGSLYASENSGSHSIGLLDGDQNWAYRHNKDVDHAWYINNVTEMSLNSSELNLSGNNINNINNMYVANYLYHYGDTDTYFSFWGIDQIAIATGGTNRIFVNNTGVRLGDTGNGYFQPVSGSFGSIQIDGGAHGGWEGYSIGGRVVFMHDNSSGSGLYNDVNNHWMFYGILNGEARLYYAGSEKLNTAPDGVTVTGDLNSTSDIRYKKNIETIDSALEKVQSLRGVTFDWDREDFNSDKRATGVIAQDVEKVLPEAVRENEDGFKNVAYGNMVGLLIEAIKEQQQQIDELKKQLNG